VPLGLIAGFRGGWLSETIMRVTDVVLAIPQLVLALALAQLMSPSLESAMLALSLTYWPFFTRIVYAETRRLSASLFVDALRGVGARSGRIVFLHILPNALSPVNRARHQSASASPSWSPPSWAFWAWARRRPTRLGPVPSPRAAPTLPRAWWYATFPGLAILITVMGFNLLGDGLRDLVDPRIRRSR